jgi:hypothetical protein
VLTIQLEATYQERDDYYEYDKTYPVIAITKSNDIDFAVKVVKELMSENDWGNFNISRYGEIKGSDDVPKRFTEQKDWQQSLNDTGAIYIVYV